MPSVTIRNQSDQTIWVEMDTHREEHFIDPGKQQDFTGFNEGDLPTFRAFRSQSDMQNNTGQVNTVKVKWDEIVGYPDYNWNGSSFEE